MSRCLNRGETTCRMLGHAHLAIWENVDDLAATVDVEMLAPFAANVDNNVEC